MAKKGLTPEQIINKLQADGYSAISRYIVFQAEFDSPPSPPETKMSLQEVH